MDDLILEIRRRHVAYIKSFCLLQHALNSRSICQHELQAQSSCIETILACNQYEEARQNVRYLRIMPMAHFNAVYNHPSNNNKIILH